MNLDKDYKFYKAIQKKNRIIQSSIFIKYLPLFIHSFSVNFLLLRNMKDFLKIQYSQITNSFQIIDKFMVENKLFQILSFLGITLVVFLILINFIQSKILLKQNKNTQDQQLQKILLIIDIGISEMYEYSVYFIFWSYIIVYQEQGEIYFFLKSTLPIVYYQYRCWRYHNRSLYNFFTFPLVLQLTLVQNSISYLAIIVVSIYLFLIKKQKIMKFIFGIVVILCFFILINKYILENNENNVTRAQIISLGISIILIALFVYKLGKQINFEKNEQKIQRLLQTLQQIKGDIPFNELNFDRVYEINSLLSSCTSKIQKQYSFQLEIILQKPYQKITKKDIYCILEQYYIKQCINAGQDHILKHIQLWRIRILLNYPMTAVIQQLFSIKNEIQKQNTKYSNDFFKLYDQALQKFGVVRNQKLQSSTIFMNNKMKQLFQSKLLMLMQKLSIFWQTLTHDKIKKEELDINFDIVLKLEEQIQRMKNHMKKSVSSVTYNKLMGFANSIMDQIQDHNSIQGQQQSSESTKNIQNDEQNNQSFLILQQNLIKFVSKKLLKSISQKKSFLLENINKNVIFGEQFSLILEDYLQNITIKSQQQKFVIPIFSKQGFMQLKNIKIIWFPSLNYKNRFLIKFSDYQQFSHAQLLIYHFKTDSIKYFNKNFIEEFNINKKKFQEQISNFSILFNQLFTNLDFLPEQIKNVLKNGQTITGKIYLKKFLIGKTLAAIPVQIKPIKYIQIQNTPIYCVLRVSKLAKMNHISNTNKTFETNKMNQPNQIFRSNQDIFAQKYKNQKFFCKIPNHYEGKILQKKAQLDQQGRWSYRNFIHALFLLIFIGVFIFWALNYNLMSNRISTYQSYNSALQNVSQQYALIYEAYSIVFLRYYTLKKPEQILLAKKVPAAVYDTLLTKSLQKCIDQFLLRYLQQINQPPNHQIQYDIEFKYFSISTDTTKSTLMDYAQAFKRNIATNQVNFLLKNYDNYRQLAVKYETAFIFEEKVIQVAQDFMKYYYLISSMTIVAIIVILYILFRIQSAIQVVYRIIDMASSQQLMNVLKKVNLKKQKFQNQYSNNKTSKLTVNSNGQLAQVQCQQEQAQSLISQIDCYSSKQQSIKSKYQENQQIHKFTPKDLKGQKQNDQKLLLQSILIKISRKLYFILLLISLNVVFYLDYSTLMEQQKGVIEALNIRKNLFLGLLRLKRLQTDTFIIPIKKDDYNMSIIDQYHTQQVQITTSIKQDAKFQELNFYMAEANKILSNNLCDKIGIYKFMTLKPCQTYLKGSTSRNFVEAYEMYQQNTRTLVNQTLEDFAPYPCTVDKCTPYYELQFSGVLLGQVLRYLLAFLDTQILSLFQTIGSQVKSRTILKLGGLIITGLIYLFLDIILKHRCKRSLRYFRIIPKQIMCSIQITTYLKKDQNLNKLDIL